MMCVSELKICFKILCTTQELLLPRGSSSSSVARPSSGSASRLILSSRHHQEKNKRDNIHPLVMKEKRKTHKKVFNISVSGLKCNMTVPLRSQCTGFWINWQVKQIIFSFILPCSLFVQPPPLTASYKLLSTMREKWDWKNRKEWSKQSGSWTSLSLRLSSPANITGQKTLFDQNTTDLVMTQQETYTKKAHQSTEHQAKTEEGSEDLSLCACGCLFRPIYTHNEKCSGRDRVTK